MNDGWSEVSPGIKWRRSDGAVVIKAGLCNFQASGPDGVTMKTKRRALRSWTGHESAMDKVDLEYPLIVSSAKPSMLKRVKERPVQAQVHKAPVPSDWTPPLHMDCGHLDCYLDGNGDCQRCETRSPPSWMHLRGTFVRPIPMGQRRTVDKQTGPCFPGLCCDSEGIYIGGTFNDCRRSSSERCVVHTRS